MFKSWPGIPLIQPLAPVRACVFFLFLGLFEALGDVGRGRGLFGWVCSRDMVLQIFLTLGDDAKIGRASSPNIIR